MGFTVVGKSNGHITAITFPAFFRILMMAQNPFCHSPWDMVLFFIYYPGWQGRGVGSGGVSEAST